MGNPPIKKVSPKVVVPSFPKEVVEGLLADAITQVKASIDSINENQDADNFLEVVRFEAATCKNIADHVDHFLGDVNDACLSPKHKATKHVFSKYKDGLAEYDFDRDLTDEEMASFARETISFLGSAHHCLSEASTRQKRHYWKKRYVDGPRFAPEI
jgi:hypothetical protein